MTDAVQKFRGLFNEIGRGYGLRWVQDSNTNGKPDLDEIEAASSFQMQHQWQHLSEPRKNALLLHSILTITREAKQKNPKLIAEIAGQPASQLLVAKQTPPATGTDLTKGYLLPNYPPRHIGGIHAGPQAKDLRVIAAGIGPRPADAEKKLGSDLFYKLRSIVDTVGVGFLSQKMVEQALMTPEQKKQGDVAEIANLTSLSKKESAMAILGYYFYTGVITLDEQLRMQIDFEKKVVADQNLFNEVASALGANSQEQGRAILAYQEYIPQDWAQKIAQLFRQTR